jgi:alkylation response protein AidB-like acyl-CoA dehydrogenase
VEIDFLHPSPHCGLKLTDVRIPAANRLGPLGDAFNAISLPMRRIEDALGAAKTAGAMRHRFRLLCQAAAKREIGAEMELALGRLAAMPEAHSAMAWRAAELLDGERDDIDETVSMLAAAARQTGKYVEGEVEAFIKAWDIEVTEALAVANRDLVKSQGIAAYARDAQARKRGQAHLDAFVSLQ